MNTHDHTCTCGRWMLLQVPGTVVCPRCGTRWHYNGCTVRRVPTLEERRASMEAMRLAWHARYAVGGDRIYPW